MLSQLWLLLCVAVVSYKGCLSGAIYRHMHCAARLASSYYPHTAQ